MMPHEAQRFLALVLFIERLGEDYVETIEIKKTPTYEFDDVKRIRFCRSHTKQSYDFQEMWGSMLWKGLKTNIPFNIVMTQLYTKYNSEDSIVVNTKHEFSKTSYEKLYERTMNNYKGFIEQTLHSHNNDLPKDILDKISDACVENKIDELKNMLRRRMAQYV